MKHRYIAVSLGILISGSVLANVQNAADEICACYQQAGLTPELIEQIKSGNIAALMENQDLLMSFGMKAEACFENLPEKYPRINESEALQNEVMGLVEEQCPNPASALMGK